jgi:pimeloyl-ACP methyl ester carboxylesterase
MRVITDLVSFSTRDGETLHGLTFTPDESGPADDLAIVLVHGIAMNFYSGPLPIVGRLLAERGYAVLCINTRGHDWIARAGNGTAFGGASYEEIEGCLPDLDAALGSLATRGYRRYVLFGHSLGGVKVLFYQGTRQRPDVVGVVSCSTPKQFYAQRVAEQPEFPRRMAEAQSLIAAGRGEELLWAPTSAAMGLFSARTYVNKYGPEERTDVRPHAARLGCPLLATAGSHEPTFVAHVQELVAVAGPGRATWYVVQGAEHFYRGYEPELTGEVVGWLEGAVAAHRV